MSNQPNYFAIIPAEIRYDETLTANAKLLYGEITALANKTGECWAGNSYFAELYGVSKETVSRWVSSLQKQGHITVDVQRDKHNAITKRSIVLTKSSTPIDENVKRGIDKNVKENSTSGNSTSRKRTPKPPNSNANNKKTKAEQHDEAVANTQLPSHLNTPAVWEAFKAFADERRDKGKYMTERAITAIINKLDPCAEDEAIEALQNSVAGGYQGVFPKTNKSNYIEGDPSSKLANPGV